MGNGAALTGTRAHPRLYVFVLPAIIVSLLTPLRDDTLIVPRLPLIVADRIGKARGIDYLLHD